MTVGHRKVNSHRKHHPFMVSNCGLVTRFFSLVDFPREFSPLSLVNFLNFTPDVGSRKILQFSALSGHQISTVPFRPQWYIYRPTNPPVNGTVTSKMVGVLYSGIPATQQWAFYIRRLRIIYTSPQILLHRFFVYPILGGEKYAKVSW